MDKNKLAVYVISLIALAGILFVVVPVGQKTIVGGTTTLQEARTFASSTTLTAGKGSLILVKQPGRQYAVITNVGGTIAYLAFNSTSTPNGTVGVANSKYTVPLAASGGSYVINDNNLYTGGILASSSAAVEIRAMEVY